MIALPSDPGAALIAAVGALAANDDHATLDDFDILDAAWAEITKRGGLLTRDHRRKALDAIYSARDRLPTAPSEPSPPGPLKLGPRLRHVDFCGDAQFVPMSWLAKGVVPREGLGLLLGESAAGKTFLAVRLALCVAWGLPFFGRRVKQGAVVYVAAEGGASVLARFKAAEDALRPAIAAENMVRTSRGETPLERAPIRLLTEAPNLSRDGSPAPLAASLHDAAQSFESAGQRLSLVVCDTWHAMLGGAEENSAADTGFALKPLRELAEARGLAVLVLHHPGKDLDRGARGSNALTAAMDTIIDLRVPGAEGLKPKSGALRRVTVVKVRDGEAGATMAYRLPVVEIGVDEDGDPATTCVVEEVAEEPATDAPRLSRKDGEVWAVVRALAAPDGSANLAVVREAFGKAAPPDAKPSAVSNAWKRALEHLTEVGMIEVDREANQIQVCTPSPTSHIHTP